MYTEFINRHISHFLANLIQRSQYQVRIKKSFCVQDGFVKLSWKFGGQKTLSDLDHCRVVLRALAHFHAYSTIIQRDSEEPLLDLWPFAVEASNFKVKSRFF